MPALTANERLAIATAAQEAASKLILAYNGHGLGAGISGAYTDPAGRRYVLSFRSLAPNEAWPLPKQDHETDQQYLKRLETAG